MRVADFVAKFIVEELGVEHVFTLTGAGIMHLTDGLACNKKIKTVCPHHEQTASMALEAYSRATENFGVGIFTTLFSVYFIARLLTSIYVTKNKDKPNLI